MMDLFATLYFGFLLILLLSIATLVQTLRFREQRRENIRDKHWHGLEVKYLQATIQEHKDHISALRVGIKSRDEAIDELLEQREKP